MRQRFDMKIIVTGGAGFIGSHLCNRLLQESHEVICVDNMYTGSMQNLYECYKYANFDMYKMDITSDSFYNTMSGIMGVDLIINLACPASPVHYQKDPTYTFMTNIIGARNVLNLANKLRVRVVQASTSEVYGDPLIHPQTEEYFGNVNTIGIRSCYDEGKRGAETLFSDYNRKYDTNSGIVRIFNTYGPHMAVNDGRVVSNFIVAALKNESIKIYGTGSQTRSFCYVDDLVDGIIRYAFTNENSPINIGNPAEFTIAQLSDIITKKIGSGNITFVDAVLDDPKQRQPDITKAKTILGWEPKVMLSDGLDKTIDYFRRKV